MPRWVRGGYAAGLAVLVTLYFALPHAPRYLWTILGVSSVLALVVGTLVNRPRHRLPWLLVAAGVSGLIAGDTTYDLLTGPLDMDNPFPSVADGFYLAMYPLIAAGLLLMVRARTTETDWEALLDALIVTIGLGLLSWVFLAQPYVADSTMSVTEKAFSIAYPFGDVLLLAVLARLVIGSGARTTSLALLTAGTLGLLSSDVLYGWIQLNGEWHTGGPVDLGWVVFYAALGGAALQPDMVRLAEPERRPLLAMSRGRLLLLGSVSLVAPGLLLWETLSGRNENIATVAVASGTLFVLVTVGLALTVPQVLLVLVGGVLSDRFERRKVMLAADVVRALALALLAWLSLSGHLALWHLVAFAGVYGAASAFFMPAFEALVPSIVPEERLTEANALDQFVRPTALWLLGPALGGLLIGATGPGGAFALDAGTFAVSVACLLRLTPRLAVACDGEEPTTVAGALTELRDGFAFVRRQPWLWATFVAATFTYLLFLGPTEVLLPYLVKNELGGDAHDLGLVLAAGGVAALVAAFLIGRTGLLPRTMTYTYLVWVVATLAVAGYGLAQTRWQAMAAAAFVSGFEAVGAVAWMTTKQRLVPGQLLGRVSSFDWFISIALVPLSYAVTAPVAELVGKRLTLIGAGVVGALVTFGFLFVPGVRDPDRVVADAAGTSPAGAASPAEATGAVTA